MPRYNSLQIRRHAAATIGLLFACAVLAGCALIEIPLGGSGNDAPLIDPIITQAATENGVTDVDPQDWKTVQDAISTSFSTMEDGASADWANSDTGSNGSIVADTMVTTEQGEICRPFRTTLDSISGVEIFSGYACRQRDGAWRITRLTPTEAGSENLPAQVVTE